jgi:hypothetical protein
VRFVILRLRIACLLRVIRLSPPRLAKLCASSPKTLQSRVSALSCFKDTFLRAVPKLGFHVWIASYALIVIMHCLIFCKCSTKRGRCLTIRIHAIYFTAIKDMAANLERKWRNQFVFMQDQVIPADDDAQGGYYYYWFRVGPSNLLSSRHETKETQAP